MATKARKPASGKGKATQSKATGSKTATPAVAARSKDAAKPSFGTAAPKKVVPVAGKATASPRKPAANDESVAGSAMRAVKATANVAAGAVVATAKGVASLAASVVGRGGSKTRAKAK
jgi:hypothetical protein